jgi:hypothetical protein
MEPPPSLLLLLLLLQLLWQVLGMSLCHPGHHR